MDFKQFVTKACAIHMYLQFYKVTILFIYLVKNVLKLKTFESLRNMFLFL